MCCSSNNSNSNALTTTVRDEEAISGDMVVVSSSVGQQTTPTDNTFLTYLVVGVMPFLYGGATRLPFIYFVIHLSMHFELSWWIIGLCVGAYQSFRVLVNILCIFAPKSAHLFGVSVGFAGYATVFLSDKDMPIPFIAGTAVIGLSETMACMQKYAKDMFKLDPDPDRVQRMLKYQYASVMIGVMFAFSLGGVAYQYYGINGVALFGMFVEGSGLLVLIYFIRNNTEISHPGGDALVQPQDLPCSSEHPKGITDLSFKTRQTLLHNSSLFDDHVRDSSTCSSNCEGDTDDIIEFYRSNNGDIERGEEEDDSQVETGCEQTEARHSSPLFDAHILEALQALHVAQTSDNELSREAGEAFEPVEPKEQGEEARAHFGSNGGSESKEELGEQNQRKAKGLAAVATAAEDVEKGAMVLAHSALDATGGEERSIQEQSGDCHVYNTTESNLALDLEMDATSVEEASLLDMATVTDTGTMMLATKIRSVRVGYHTSEIPATWLNYLVCVSFGIEALTIGYNLSIGPVFILNVFDVNTGITGFLFGVGAGFGAIITICVTCTEFGNRLLRKIAESPYDLCFAMGGIAIGVFVASIQIFPVHIFGLLLLMAFNDLGATLLTEFQGSITTVSTYSVLGPLGQVVRRTLNVVTAVTGPILYGFFPSLPYIVAGTITLLWTIMLAIAFKFRSKDTAKNLASVMGRSDHSVRSIMSFKTREVIRSVSMHSMHSIQSLFSASNDDSSLFSMAEDSECTDIDVKC